jgi:hypothetical protein
MKKLIVLFTILVMVSSAFAQNPKSTGLTDSDVKSWAKNLKSIEREFDDAGISRDDVKSASKQEKAKAETILQKYGISAPNRIEKLAMINQCATLVMAENGVAGAGAGIDPNTMAMLKKMNIDPFAELKANINQKDYKVVQANSKAVINAMNGIDEASAPAASAGQAATGKAAGSATNNAASNAAANSQPQDYAAEQVAIMRAGNPEMTDEEAEVMAQTLRKQPNYAMHQAQWAMLHKESSKASQKSAQNAEEEFKRINDDATNVKNAIDELTKSKGDCGFIYKSADKGTYTKKKPNDWESLMIQVQGRSIALIPVTTKGKKELNFTWDEPKINKITPSKATSLFERSEVETTEMSKTITLDISSIELYESSDKNSSAKEYVISTKDGKVIHLWLKYGGSYETRVNFKGMKNAAWSWGETGGN